MRTTLRYCLLGMAAAKANGDIESKSEQTLIKRTDLPVYSEVPKFEKKNDEVGNSIITDAVKALRIEGCKVARTAQTVSDRCSQFINTGIAHSQANYQNTVEYLQADKNLLPRIGAIGGGALFGYVLGIRRGFIRRIIYMSAGGTAVAAVCYPNEANDYFKQSSQTSKRYFMIGYHFVNGVTKDFIGFELPVLQPKISNQDNQESAKDDSK